MCYSGSATILTTAISFVVGYIGKKKLTLMIFAMSTSAGIVLLLIKIPLLSILIFIIFLYISFILGNMNTYLVELNPTHLRGMATCLSVVVARGFGFISVQIIAELLAEHCQLMVTGNVILLFSGLVVSCFLPSDQSKSNKQTHLPSADLPDQLSETPQDLNSIRSTTSSALESSLYIVNVNYDKPSVLVIKA
ncbi:uncharacterized protein LOC113237952 [Hyposmocoma kahamanoa]|uniref:uncharacterized protein LOC113237952 n=1 Tax=Hyposmocoma kahamanoa TaxID=1477025 RepID=UPI000E6D9831|nr:uncharacterized protein LOC113237952 [Hyposmocoma kahamanoa]